MSVAVLLGIVAIGLAGLLDVAATEFVRQSDLAVVRLMAEWTDVGRSQWYLVPAAVAFIGLGLWNWTNVAAHGRARLMLFFGQAGFAFAAVAGTGLAVNVIKFLFGRSRPILFEQVGAYDFEPFSTGYSHVSFPSGHSATMGAVAMVLVLWFPRMRVPLLVVGLFLAATRIAARAHYPSDVMAGYAFGLIATLALARYLATRRIVFRFDGGRLLPLVRRGLRTKWTVG